MIPLDKSKDDMKCVFNKVREYDFPGSRHFNIITKILLTVNMNNFSPDRRGIDIDNFSLLRSVINKGMTIIQGTGLTNCSWHSNSEGLWNADMYFCVEGFTLFKPWYSMCNKKLREKEAFELWTQRRGVCGSSVYIAFFHFFNVSKWKLEPKETTTVESLFLFWLTPELEKNSFFS